MLLHPLICVDDVEASSLWYQQLLDLTSGHGGRDYERLLSQGSLVLQLHRWDVDHQHGPLGDSTLRPYGNGVLLWFRCDDFDAAVARARGLHAQIVKEPHLSENGNWECWLHDPDGYKLVLTSRLPES